MIEDIRKLAEGLTHASYRQTACVIMGSKAVAEMNAMYGPDWVDRVAGVVWNGSAIEVETEPDGTVVLRASRGVPVFRCPQPVRRERKAKPYYRTGRY